MGVRSCQRGTQIIRKNIDSKINSDVKRTFEIISRINSYPKGTRTFFGEGVIRIASDGAFWIMSHKDTRWGSRGYRYLSMKSLMASWCIKVTGLVSDQYSSYYTIRGL